MSKTICVYCSSSDAIDRVYFEAAAELGRQLAVRGWSLVYGGGNVGLMGAVAEAVHAEGGRVVGVIPRTLADKGLAYAAADEMIITRDLRERKATMEARADAFIALPGGFGTLEELVEIVTLKQLSFHSKAMVLLNTAGFYDGLLEVFERMYALQFAKPVYRKLYHVADTAADALDHIAAYQPPVLDQKWYGQPDRAGLEA
ncbi:MAG: TIGR00730 family Rossman fold protein [Phycisphaerae bacterium]|nr:TIGR00730 family Rossman fold protein [Phycisphaerae bacterium]